MTPWEVIEEALAQRKPRRDMKWLAEQLKEKIQVVSNWKARRVPPGRYREIATVLGLTVDQIEGIEPPPWEVKADAGLPPEILSLARDINALPDPLRKLAIEQIRLMLAYGPQLAQIARSNTNGTETHQVGEKPSSELTRRRR